MLYETIDRPFEFEGAAETTCHNFDWTNSLTRLGGGQLGHAAAIIWLGFSLLIVIYLSHPLR